MQSLEVSNTFSGVKYSDDLFISVGQDVTEQ
jgi:hypothetical protein